MYHKDNPSEISAIKHMIAAVITIIPHIILENLLSGEMYSMIVRAIIPETPGSHASN